MSVPAQNRRRSPDALWRDLAARLQARHPEIEQAVRTRVHSVADPDPGDPTYAEGLLAAVSAAISYAIDGLRGGESRPAPLPAELLSQARRAARDHVPLETVLRRYIAGHALLEDYMVEEADLGDLGSVSLQDTLRSVAAILDHLVAAVATECRDELEARSRSPHRRRVESVERLLAGEHADDGDLNYVLDAWHVAVIATGPGVEQEIRSLASELDRRLLLVPRGENAIWAWLGSAREPRPDEFESLGVVERPARFCFAFGEPARGLGGWRLTHRQAAAALPIAQRGPNSRVRYAEVPLLASALQDEVLRASLHDLYLAPIARERDGGATLRQTLRAYFVAERNVSSAAITLGVDRKTVKGRLRAIEQCLGRPLVTCAGELETALGLQELGVLP